MMYKIIGADQKEYGPVSAEQLRQWLAEGRANAQTPVQAAGTAGWKPLAAYPELRPCCLLTPWRRPRLRVMTPPAGCRKIFLRATTTWTSGVVSVARWSC